jgi:hypothetical protein
VEREAEAVSPLTGRKLQNYCATHEQRSAFSQIKIESDSVNDVTSEKSPKIQKSGCNSKVMVVYKTHRNSLEGYSNHSVLIKHSMNEKCFNMPPLRRTYL